MDITLKGEVRCVVKDKNNKIKLDTGYCGNTLTELGRDYIGQSSVDIAQYCAVGKNLLGNTNNKVVSKTTSVDGNFGALLENEYEVSLVYKYAYSALGEINQVGFVSGLDGNNLLSLCDIKNTLGQPVSVSISSNEVLTVYYKVTISYSLADFRYLLNLSDGKGGGAQYNLTSRIVFATLPDYFNTNNIALSAGNLNKYAVYISSQELSAVDSYPVNYKITNGVNINLGAYIEGTFKREIIITLSSDSFSDNIKTLIIQTPLGFWQISFKESTTLGGLLKTQNDALKFTFELSWS